MHLMRVYRLGLQNRTIPNNFVRLFFRFASAAPREGAYIHGLFMEGARWDTQSGIIVESRLKELFPSMPVINVRVC